ncbi:MAG TPA: dethiobiotin synthase [Burkholderiaceae bacterium]|nr:dethiobiotin synthase [Burkholderiaceae bacterium]HRP28181.1 dethiobiotin synthase [Burkholderiaceae bacterium]
MRQAYFLTGTDLAVGKSLIATGFLYTGARSWDLKVLGLKPVVAGPGDDIDRLVAASNVESPRHYINPYHFDEPVAPNIAAKGVGKTIDLGHIKYCFDEVRGRADLVIVEGIGGFCAPLNDSETVADLAKLLALPVIVVVGLKQGCLNHTLLTIDAIKAKGLPVAGWVANEVERDMQCVSETVTTLKTYLAEPLLGYIRYQDQPDGKNLVKQLSMPD